MAPAILTDERDAAPVDSGKPTLYLLDSFHPEAEKYCRKRFNAIFPGEPGHENWRQNAEYLLIRGSYLTAEDVAQSPKLKAIGKQGVGIDKIDAKACAARDIKIFNTPGVNARAVAEATLALVLGVAREFPRIVAQQTLGNVVPKEKCSGLILYKKTIGLIGMGNIGKAVAKIFQGGFDAEIVAYDPFMPADAWSDLPHKRVQTVEEVLRASDVVSIHVPLTPQTRDMISYPQLEMMKRTAILVNAARGGIVNEKDLEAGLRDGLIWGAGLDCHEQEPPTKEKYGALWEQRVLSTPHLGSCTSQTQMETAIAAASNLYEYIQSQGL